MKLPFFNKKSSAPNPPEESMELILAKLTAFPPEAAASPEAATRCLVPRALMRQADQKDF
jgi:hypothetical protein